MSMQPNGNVNWNRPPVPLPPSYGNTPSPSPMPVLPAPRKSKTKWWIPVVAIAVVLVMVLAGGVFLTTRNNQVSHVAKSSNTAGEAPKTQNPGYGDGSSSSAEIPKTLYEALHTKRIWFVVSTSTANDDSDSESDDSDPGYRTIYKDDYIRQILQSDGQGNVIAYHVGMKVGDIRGLSDSQIIKKAKRADEDDFNKRKQEIIDNVTNDKRGFDSCESEGGDVGSDGCAVGDDYVLLYDYDGIIENANKTSYSSPEKQNVVVSIKTDGTGNGVKWEGVSYKNRQWIDPSDTVEKNVCDSDNCFADTTEDLYLDESISATVYDKTLSGFVDSDSSFALVSAFDSSFAGLTFDSPDTKGIKIDED